MYDISAKRVHQRSACMTCTKNICAHRTVCMYDISAKRVHGGSACMILWSIYIYIYMSTYIWTVWMYGISAKMSYMRTVRWAHILYILYVYLGGHGARGKRGFYRQKYLKLYIYTISYIQKWAIYTLPNSESACMTFQLKEFMVDLHVWHFS